MGQIANQMIIEALYRLQEKLQNKKEEKKNEKKQMSGNKEETE